MTKTGLKLVALLAATGAITACSNSYTYEYGNTYGHTQMAQNYACQDVYIPNPCGGLNSAQPIYTPQNLRGSQPLHNAHHGTILRGSAPYGMAVDNTPYVSTQSYTHDQGGYFNIGAISYDMDSNLYGVQGRLGYNANPYLGAELEGSIGVSEDTIGAALTSIDHSAAAFAIAQVPYTNRIKFLARVGYHTTQYGGAGSSSLDTDGYAYGVGTEFAINPHSALRLDYTRYQSNALKDNDALSLVYARKF